MRTAWTCAVVTLGIMLFASPQVVADQVERERKRTERMQDEHRGTTPKSSTPSVYTRHKPIKYKHEKLETAADHRAYLERNTPWMYTEEGKRWAREAREARKRRNESSEAARKWKKSKEKFERGQRRSRQQFRNWASQVRVRHTPYQPGQCDYYSPTFGSWTTVANCSVATDVATHHRNDLLERARAPKTNAPIRIEKSGVALPPLKGITPALCRDLQTLLKAGERSGGFSRYKGARSARKRVRILDLPAARKIPKAVMYDQYIDMAEIPLYSGKDQKSMQKLIPGAQKSLRRCLEKVRPVFGAGDLVSKGAVVVKIRTGPWTGGSPYAGQPWTLSLTMTEISPKGMKLRDKFMGVKKKTRVDQKAAAEAGLSPALCTEVRELVKAAARRGGLRKYRGKRVTLPDWKYGYSISKRTRTYALKKIPEASARPGSAFLATKPTEVHITLGKVNGLKELGRFYDLARPFVKQCAEQVSPAIQNTALYTKSGVTLMVAKTGKLHVGAHMYLEIKESTAEARKFYKVLDKPPKF